MASTQELLDAIEEAIIAVSAGQSYSLRGRSVTKANLSSLMDTRRELREELQRESGAAGGSMSTLGRLDPRS